MVTMSLGARGSGAARRRRRPRGGARLGITGPAKLGRPGTKTSAARLLRLRAERVEHLGHPRGPTMVVAGRASGWEALRRAQVARVYYS